MGMTEVAYKWEVSYMMDSLTDDIYDMTTDILREVEDEVGGGDEVHRIR